MKVPVEKILQYNKWKMKNDADNMNSYGGCVFRYAEQWTELMEKEIDGYEDETELFQKLVYCAEELSFLADTEGVTGAQHYMAMNVIRECWEYGTVFYHAVRYCEWKQRYEIRKEIRKERENGNEYCEPEGQPIEEVKE